MKLKPTKKLSFLDVVPDFRAVADLIEGLDALSSVTKKDENPGLRERLMIILCRLDRVDSRYYEQEIFYHDGVGRDKDGVVEWAQEARQLVNETRMEEIEESFEICDNPDCVKCGDGVEPHGKLPS